VSTFDYETSSSVGKGDSGAVLISTSQGQIIGMHLSTESNLASTQSSDDESDEPPRVPTFLRVALKASAFGAKCPDSTKVR